MYDKAVGAAGREVGGRRRAYACGMATNPAASTAVPRRRRREAETRLGLVRRARRINRILAETYPDAHCELDFGNPLELLVATILSAQCTDKRVNMVTPVLFAKYRTAADYAGADRAELEEIIKSTGFFRAKANSIIGMAQALCESHEGRSPAGSPTWSSCPAWAARPRTSCSATPSTCPASPSTRTSSG